MFVFYYIVAPMPVYVKVTRFLKWKPGTFSVSVDKICILLVIIMNYKMAIDVGFICCCLANLYN